MIIIKQIKPHPLAYFFYYFIGALVVIVSILSSLWFNIIIGVAIIIIVEIFRRAYTYSIYETGVEKQFKFIIVTKTFIDYSKIQDLSVERNMIDRIFGIGKIMINTAGSPGTEINFTGVQNPEEIEKMIREKLRR